MSADLSGNLWRLSEFQNIFEKLQIPRQSDLNYVAENARFVALSTCCKPSPLKVHHELYDVTNSPLFSRFVALSTCPKPSPLHSCVVCSSVLRGVVCSSVLQCCCFCCWRVSYRIQHTATHCNTLQHTATHCNTLSYRILWLQRLRVYTHTHTHCMYRYTCTYVKVYSWSYLCCHWSIRRPRWVPFVGLFRVILFTFF